MHSLASSVQKVLDEYSVAHKVLECDPEVADTAAFCERYGFSPEQSANTIIVMSRKVEPVKYAACVILATTKLDVNKKICELLGVKRASFADGETTQELTGMMIGGVTAVGITNLPIYIDSRVMDQPEVVMGGGNRSSKLLLTPQELAKLSNTQVVTDLALVKD